LSITRWFLFLCVLSASVESVGQLRDSSYVDPYNRQITTRVFLSRKYTIFGVEGSDNYRQIQYRPNTKLNIGVGATYRALTVNLAMGLPNNEDSKGNTRYLDLQTHLYGAKWAYDLFGQFYRGYFIYPRGYGASDGYLFYQRPDLHVREIGLNAYHIYNNKRFSYRAAFLESEWQKKSAGSFLLGGHVVLGNIFSDSAFIPSALSAFYQQKEVRRLRYLEFGPGAGYAYTFVYREHLYATSSLTLSPDLGFVREYTSAGSKVSVNVSPNILFRIGMGYNSRQWNTNFAWVMSRTSLKGQFNNAGYNVNSGHYRLTVARRFSPGWRMKKHLRVLDKVMDPFFKL